MEELKKELESITPELTRDELNEQFCEIAKLFMKNYGIEANGNVYHLNEIEFYYYGKNYDDKRTDTSNETVTYKRTSNAGCWFIHDYGVDLTFKSNQQEGYGGGILIRTIENEKSIIGPVKCVNELWEEAVDAFSNVASNPKIVRIPQRNVDIDDPTRRINSKGEFIPDINECKWRFTIKGKEVSKIKE